MADIYFWRQTWTMSAVLINVFGHGLMFGYSTSLLPALVRPDSPIKVDLQSSSWIISIIGVASIPGFFISSVLMAVYGRRTTHGVAILPGAIGWLLIYFAKDVPTLMIGRFLCGLYGGGTVYLGAIVIGEYTCPRYRGVFLHLKNAAVCMGAMVMHLISHYLHWRINALISLVPLFIALIIIYTWPESPAWLASKHQYDKSIQAFYWLRGKSESSRLEIEDFLKTQKTKLSRPKIKSSYGGKVLDLFKKFTQNDFVKPFSIMMLATTVKEMSGKHVFPAYALTIMSEITGEHSQSFYYTLCIDLIVTASAVFASILVKLMCRRTLLFSTGFASLLVLMSVCSYLYLVAKGKIPDDKLWVPTVLLVLYFMFVNFGCTPVPLTLVGEVFPLAHREVGLTLSGVWASMLLVVGLKSPPYLIVNIGVYGLFAVYGTIMGIALLILYFIMPETKDRTLQEIENYFNYGKFTNGEDEEAITKMIKE